jgi:hypothetical protein
MKVVRLKDFFCRNQKGFLFFYQLPLAFIMDLKRFGNTIQEILSGISVAVSIEAEHIYITLRDTGTFQTNVKISLETSQQMMGR